MRAHLLKNISINWISLVPAGANRREFLAKGDNGFTVSCEIRKIDEDKRQVTGVLYPIGQIDTQGDFTTEAELDAAMLDFQAKGRAAAGRAGDVNHDEQATADYFPEVWKIREGDPLFPDDVGAWAVTRQIVDDERWEQVKSGVFKAFSFGGTALRVFDQEVTKAQDTAILKRMTVAVIKGLLADQIARRELPNLIESTYEALWEAYYSTPYGEERPAMLAVIEELTPMLKENTKENTMDKKSLLKFFMDSVGAALGTLLDKMDPEGAPAAAPASDQPAADPAEAVKAALAVEHEASIAALKAEHEAALKAVQDELEALKKSTPGSARQDINQPPAGTVIGGIFTGRVAS